LTKKIEHWHFLEWSDFEKELKRIKLVLAGEQKEDWFERFNRLKAEAQTLKTEIDKTDREIDQMVYELYDLTEEEIQIVENN
jgi:ketosteroid isomerase-like protein